MDMQCLNFENSMSSIENEPINYDLRANLVIVDDFNQIKRYDRKSSNQISRDRLAPNSNLRSYEDLKNEYYQSSII